VTGQPVWTLRDGRRRYPEAQDGAATVHLPPLSNYVTHTYGSTPRGGSHRASRSMLDLNSTLGFGKQTIDSRVSHSAQRYSNAFNSRSPRFAPTRYFSGQDPRQQMAAVPFKSHDHKYCYPMSMPGASEWPQYPHSLAVREPSREHGIFSSSVKRFPDRVGTVRKHATTRDFIAAGERANHFAAHGFSAF